MIYLLLTILILDAFLLMTIVLLQAGKGGGLAAMGAAGAGSDTLFGGRQAATILTKATWWTGGIFLGLSFILSMMAGGNVAPAEPILRGNVQTPAGVPGLPAPREGTEGAAPVTPATPPQGQE